MGADADADVEVAGEREFGGCAGGFELSVFTGDEGVEKVAAFFDADGFGRGDVGLDFVGVRAARVAELERGEADSVDGDVDAGRVAVEGLADHQYSLAMGIAACAEEGDIGGETHVA